MAVPALPTPLEAVLALADGQGGAFTRAQALTAGLAPETLARLVRTKQLRVVRRQVYAVAGPRTAHAELLVRASARQLKVADSVVSHRWAAALQGFELLGNLPAEPDLIRPRPPGQEPATVPGLHVAALPASHRSTMQGVPITSKPRTLVDCARTLDVEAALVVADSAVRARSGRAADVLADCRGWPGIEQARTVLGLADARADSALESRSRWRLHVQGLPAPELQLTLCDAHGRHVGEVDFVWLDRRTILETDGRLKYTSDEVLWAEKLREDALRALGFVVVRGYWSDSAEALAAKVRAGFVAAQNLPAADYGYRYTPRRQAQRAL
jgi:hypothetical protein